MLWGVLIVWFWGDNKLIIVVIFFFIFFLFFFSSLLFPDLHSTRCHNPLCLLDPEPWSHRRLLSLPTPCGAGRCFYCEKSIGHLFPLCTHALGAFHWQERERGKNSMYEKKSLTPGLEPMTCLSEGYVVTNWATGATGYWQLFKTPPDERDFHLDRW